MLTFKYSEFMHLIQSDFWYMVGSTGAIAVLCCGVTLVVAEIFHYVARMHPIQGLIKIYRVWRAL